MVRWVVKRKTPPSGLEARAWSLTKRSKDDLGKKTIQDQGMVRLVTHVEDNGDHPEERNQPSTHEGGGEPSNQPQGRVVGLGGSWIPNPLESVSISVMDGTGLGQLRPTESLMSDASHSPMTDDRRLEVKSLILQESNAEDDEGNVPMVKFTMVT